jgi:hypothetical protein
MNRYIDITLISLLFVIALSVSMSLFADFDPAQLPAELAQNLDLNGDGVIGPQEQARAERLRARVDWNHDGAIGERERERAQQAFEYADRDKDGQLSAHERVRNRYTYNQLDLNDDGRISQYEQYERRFVHELRDNARGNGVDADRQL